MERSETVEALAAYGCDEDERRGFALLPWSLAGMGLFVAWLCCTHLPGCFVAATAHPEAATFVDYLMRLGDVGTFVLVFALARRAGPLCARPRPCAACACACAACTLLTALAADAGAPRALVGALSLAAGAGGAVVFLVWAEVYGRLGPARCLFFGGASCLTAALTSLLVSRLDAGAATVAVALLPLASAVLAGIARSRLAPEPAPADRPGSGGRYPVPWKLVALMSLAGFGSGFAGSLLVAQPGVGAVHRIAATALVGAALLGVSLARTSTSDVRFLAWATLPVAVASLAAIPLAGEGHGLLVSFFVKLSYVSFAAYVLLVLANVAWRHDVPSARVFAAARAASEGAMLAGIALRTWMRSSGLLDNQTTLWLIALVGLVAVLGCVVLWHTERAADSQWGLLAVDEASGEHVPTARELELGRCARVAAEAGLTPRETEVLELLVQGLDPARIEETLFLSHNTLKTHLRHIYAKLGAHTRQEVVGLVREG